MSDNFDNFDDEEDISTGVEVKCEYCHQQEMALHSFTGCKHKICVMCLYRYIFTNYLQEMKNSENLNITCKCGKGKTDKNLGEIHEIIKAKADITQKAQKSIDEVSTFKLCHQHPSCFINYYCVNCSEHVCKNCTLSDSNPHHFHRIISVEILYKSILASIQQLPTKFCDRVRFEDAYNKMQLKIKQSTEKQYNEVVKQIDELISQLTNFKKQFEIDYMGKLQRWVNTFRNYKLYFFNYIIDRELCNKVKDINLLRFVNNIDCELVDLTITHNKSLSKRISDMSLAIDDLKKGSKDFIHMDFSFCPVMRGFRCEDILPKAHDSMVAAIVQAPNENLITGSDYSIKVWEEKEDGGYKQISSITKNTGDISKLLILNDKKLISSFFDSNVLRVWAPENKSYTLSNTLTAHKGPVCSIIQLQDDRLVTGSKDKTIIIWNYTKEKSFEPAKVTTEERGPILCLINLTQGGFVSSAENIIKVWRETSNASLFESGQGTTAGKDKQKVRCLCQLKSGQILSGGDGNYILRFKIAGNELKYIKSTNAHKADINSIIQLSDGRVASASKDRNIKIWKIKDDGMLEEEEVLAEYPHGMYILIELIGGRICSTASDCSVVLWRNRNDKY